MEICNPSPKTTLKLIQRLKALIMELIPDEVDIEQLKLPEVKNQVISPDTVSVFVDAGGDCRDAVPFCLLKLKGLYFYFLTNDLTLFRTFQKRGTRRPIRL